MDDRARAALAEHFCSFIQIYRGRHADENHDDFPVLGGVEKHAFEDLTAKWNARREFKNNNVSQKTIEDRLKRAAVDALNDSENSDAVARELIERLLKPMDCVIVLPISGIDLRDVSFVLADDVRAVFLSEEVFNDIVVRGYEAAEHAGMPCHGEPRQFARLLAENLRPDLQDRSVLLIRASGDENSAQWAAEHRADLAVDALQFAASLMGQERWKIYIDWRGDAPAMAWQRTAIIPVRGYVWPANPGRRTGTLAPWRPLQQHLTKFQEENLFDLVRLPLKRGETPHEDMLARAIRSFSYGDRQPTADGKKQAYVTVFDIFFSLPGEETTRSIREGVAFTMYAISAEEQHDEARFEQAKFINQVYDSRSDTTHEFQVGAFEPEDLELLRLIALNFIYRMWKDHNFASKAAVQEWLQQRRDELGERYGHYENLSRRRDLHVDDGADA